MKKDIRAVDLKEQIGPENIKLILEYIKIKVAEEKTKSKATTK